MIHFNSKLVKRLLHQSSYLAEAYHRLFLATLAKKRDTLLVYQMGKVGSSTVVRSLRSLKPDMSVHHVHMLAPEGIERFEAFVRERFHKNPKLTMSQRARLVKHLAVVKHLRKQLDRTHLDRKWKVVTLVRDPVARNLSGFFEILDLQLKYDLEKKVMTKSIDELVAELNELFLDEYPDHELPLVFFNSELERVFGIDVYNTPFPKSKGFKIYKNKNIEILILRLENLAERAREAFEEFLGIEGLTLKRLNIGSEKCYAQVYRDFLDKIKLPESYLQKMYRSKYATHFYSHEEIQAFEMKWGSRANTYKPNVVSHFESRV